MSRRPQRRTTHHLHFARALRSQLTIPEQKLWAVLQNRRLAGLKFIRQMPVEQFIADFACRECRLIIEVDGESHADRGMSDRIRKQLLESAGWRIIRVANEEVLTNLEGVPSVIASAAASDPATWREGE